MTSITKPPVRHPSLPKNALGLTRRDYEGAMSTLCAGCGHDSVTAALVQALWELDVPPHRAAKMSGIGCSSKTTAYFMRQSHGFNGVHGRMPSLATGANAANKDLVFVGISGAMWRERSSSCSSTAARRLCCGLGISRASSALRTSGSAPGPPGYSSAPSCASPSCRASSPSAIEHG